MIYGLADLIAPCPVEQFLKAIDARDRMHICTDAPTRMDCLLTWSTINALLPRLFAEDKLAVQRDSVILTKNLYSKNGRFHPAAFHKLAAQGASVVVNSLDERLPHLAALAAAIERRLGVRAWVAAPQTSARLIWWRGRAGQETSSSLIEGTTETAR